MRRLAVLILLCLPVSLFGSGDCPAPVPPLAVVVRPTDIDDKGHVNNARYVEYLQWGRWDYLTGRDIPSLPENVALVVVNINLDYKKEIRFGETVFVKTAVDRVGNKSVTFRQQIVDRMRDVCAEGTVTMVSMDLSTRKSCPLPEPTAKALRDAVR